MKITDEQLMAYADDELGADDAARVEAAIAAEPALADVVARHRALRRELRDAFAPSLDEPVPERLLALLREPVVSNVVPLATRREQPTARRWALPEWAAIAAALALGIAVSQWALAPGGSGLVDGGDGGLVAGRDLSRQLDQQLAGDALAGGIDVGLSFRNAEGAYCRSFVADASPPLAGLACRRGDGRWQLPVLVESSPAPGGELQQASSALPGAVLAELDARIDGEPLDASQERAARDAGWR